MGSTRLPGKTLAELAGRPLIDHVLARLQRAVVPHGPLSQLVLATSRQPADTKLARHMAQAWPTVAVVRDAEADVLGRFVRAAAACDATTVVRVTADCPLVNADAIAGFVADHQAASADVTNYQPGIEVADKGIEVVSVAALRRANADPATTGDDREHVTAAMYRQPDRYRINYRPAPAWLRRGDLRLVVDTPADLAFFRALCAATGQGPAEMDLAAVLALLDRRPDLLAINATAAGRSTRHEQGRLGFRCNGGPDVGLGHVVGSLRLARLLADDLGIGCEFVCADEPATNDLVRRAGFPVRTVPAGLPAGDDAAGLQASAIAGAWAGIVLNFDRAGLEAWQPHFGALKAADHRLICQDNPVPPGWRQADILINALPHPAYPGYDPAEHPACLDGLAYFLPATGAPSRNGPEPAEVRRILVALGGGSTATATALALEGIAQAGFASTCDVVIGAAAPDHLQQTLRAQLDALGLHGTVSRGVNDLPDRMAAADLGIAGLGLIAYEMAHAGLPALIVSGSAFNAAVAERYARTYGAAKSLGLADMETPARIAVALRDMAADVEARAVMAAAGRARVGTNPDAVVELISGILGVGRIAA